jgi:hypothetical protein
LARYFICGKHNEQEVAITIHVHRNEGFSSTLNCVNKIASELGVELLFPLKHHFSRTKDEAECEEAMLQTKEDFQVN